MLRLPALRVPLTFADAVVNNPVKVALPADKLIADTFPVKVALAAVIAFVILKLIADRDPVKNRMFHSSYLLISFFQPEQLKEDYMIH